MAQKSTSSKTTEGFTAEEKAAMKARIKELKATQEKEEGEKAVLEAIAEMVQPDRGMAERIHAIIKANAPSLSSRTWYGMPAYANSEGRIICFFQTSQKFKARYSTLGFNDGANLDEGVMWPTSFALKDLSPAEEEKIAALVKKAVS